MEDSYEEKANNNQTSELRWDEDGQWGYYTTALKKEKSYRAYDIIPHSTSEYHSINGYSLGRMLLG